MNIFQELGNLYFEINNFYTQNEFKSRARGWHKKEMFWLRKKELNDHAYFLFMFTRLEDRIREQSSKLILRKQTQLRAWKQKRVWDLLPKDKENDSINFKKRLELLVVKGERDYTKVVEYYNLRNEVAHGGNLSRPVSIPTVIVDFKNLYRNITA